MTEDVTRRGIDEVGRDHWSLLLYLETRAVDHRGVPDFRNMRCCKHRHPLYGHALGALLGWDAKCATLMPDGSQPDPEHDDWDCVEDLIALQLIVWGGTGAQPVFELTDIGWLVAGVLRRARAEHAGNVAEQHKAAVAEWWWLARGVG